MKPVLIVATLGLILPAVVGVMIGLTPNTVLSSYGVGQFVTATSSGGFRTVTSVQTTSGSIAVRGAFSALHGQQLTLQDTLKAGLELCVEGQLETCATLVGPWPGELETVPHVRPWTAPLVTYIGPEGVFFWLLLGAPFTAIAGIASAESPPRES